MSKDISTMFSRSENKKCGRKGYYDFKHKETVIAPNHYGMFLQENKKEENNDLAQ